MAPSVDEQLEALMFGAEYGDAELKAVMGRELRERLAKAAEQGRPLRVYCGYDPSAPDIHLGHTITLRKLRQFQDFGHHVIFLVGTFTAQVGDTSDKATGRPRKTPEQVLEAAQTYADQCFKVLDRSRTEVVYNGDWLSKLDLSKFIELASQFTVQQFIVRDNYRQRIEKGNPIGLHEFFYALFQGYDAVHLEADVQLGATEQLFNIMAGRKLQQGAGQEPCVCLTFPILVGTDGKDRMSKSKGNYVGIAEPPDEQFGKVMSVSDETMRQWLLYVTRWPVEKIQRALAGVDGARIHPMQLKKDLAREVVAAYHGDAAAESALQRFEQVHQHHEIPAEMPELRAEGPVNIVDLLVNAKLAASRSKARQLIDGKAVRVDGKTVADQKASIEPGVVVQVGRRGFVRLVK